jgi:aspartokinase/homoserine dehydrogenase 1
MKVLKFGGSSVADAKRIAHAGSIIGAAREQGPVVVVVSALGGTTDTLGELADGAGSNGSSSDAVIDRLLERHLQVASALCPKPGDISAEIRTTVDILRRLVTGVEYIGDCPPAVRDRILACGERLAAPLVAAALTAAGHPAHPVDGADVIATDAAHGAAIADLDRTRDFARTRICGAEPSIPVVTGFIGADPEGRTTTLGRGGSDLTATVLGAVLDAAAVEIWTDVNGIFTAPPREVPGARPQPYVSYDEAAELARFGAAVLFSDTIAPVRSRSIPVLVRNTFDPDGPSTLVDGGPEIPNGARSLAAVERTVVFKLGAVARHSASAGVLGEIVPRCLVAALAAAGDSTLVVRDVDADAVHRRLTETGLTIQRVDGTSVVAVVGTRLLEQPWVVGRALEALGRRGVSLDAVLSPSEHSVCVVVDRDDRESALTILHDALMLAHLATRASDAARRDRQLKGGNHDATATSGSGARRDRDRRPAARPPAA